MNNPFDPGYFESDELREMGFGAVGENVRIARNCTIIGLGNIFIGESVRIDGHCTITVASGSLRLGDYVHIHTCCTLGCRGGIELDDFSNISHGVRLMSASDDLSGNWMIAGVVPPEFTRPTVAPIRLERHAAVAMNSCVFPGVTLGEGAMVGALSLVNESLAPWGIYAGAPVRRLKDRSRAIVALESEIRGRLNAHAA